MILLRYLCKEIIQATLAVSVVLLLIVMSGRLAKYLTQASEGDLAANVVMWVVLYRIPDFLPLVLPLGLFIGVLLAYGRLYVESEMIVITACGRSKGYLARVTLLPAFLLAAIVAFLSLWAAPTSLGQVQAILKDPINRQGLAILQQGKFQATRDGKRITYAERLNERRDEVQHITMVEHGEQGALTVIRAQRGKIETNERSADKYFTLQSGIAYEGIVGRSDYQVTEFLTFGQRLERSVEHEKLQLKDDAKPTSALWDSALSADRATLHWRYSLPTIVPIVALLALALSRTDHRRGRFAKLLPAILMYLLYIVTITAVRDLVANQGVTVAAFWLVHALFLAIGLALLYWQELRQRIIAPFIAPPASHNR